MKQEPPLPVAVELAQDVAPEDELAEAIGERLRGVLVVQARVELVPWGTLQRSEYKSKLVDREHPVESAVDAERARELLNRERQRIERALVEQAGGSDGELSTIDQHLGDQGSELYEDEFEAGLRERLLNELAAVERAEARVDAGTYGLSVESGEPIPDERLEAIPTAERTAEEQGRFEGRRWARGRASPVAAEPRLGVQAATGRQPRRGPSGGDVFALAAFGLLVLLAVVSMMEGWELVDVPGWIWLIVAIPEVLLVVAIAVDAPRTVEITVIFVVVSANLCGLALLITSLITEDSSDLSGGQLLMSGAVLWLTNVIVFGLLYWSLDAGGPRARAERGRRRPDFWFPQDDNDRLARTGWHPRLEDYAYVALTNGIAFSPTDAMPLTRRAKTLMGLDALISVGAVLLVAARAVNVLGA